MKTTLEIRQEAARRGISSGAVRFEEQYGYPLADYYRLKALYPGHSAFHLKRVYEKQQGDTMPTPHTTENQEPARPQSAAEKALIQEASREIHQEQRERFKARAKQMLEKIRLAKLTVRNARRDLAKLERELKNLRVDG